jgi:hypothetical protein
MAKEYNEMIKDYQTSGILDKKILTKICQYWLGRIYWTDLGNE